MYPSCSPMLSSNRPMFSLLVSFPLSMYLQRVCSTVLYHTLLLLLAVSLFAKHREPACPWCWFRGRCGCCWERAWILCWSQSIYTANIQTASYHNRSNMPVSKVVSLCSTSGIIKRSKETDGGANVNTDALFSLLLSTQNNWLVWQTFLRLCSNNFPTSQQHVSNPMTLPNTEVWQYW